MKFTLFLFTAFVFPFLLFAQADVYKIVANETCACLQQKDISKLKNRTEVEMAMGFCMLESAGRQNLDIDFSDQEAMRKFGEKVGVQMALVCPEVFSSFFNKDGQGEPALLSGQVKSVDVGDLFTSISKKMGAKNTG